MPRSKHSQTRSSCGEVALARPTFCKRSSLLIFFCRNDRRRRRKHAWQMLGAAGNGMSWVASYESEPRGSRFRVPCCSEWKLPKSTGMIPPGSGNLPRAGPSLGGFRSPSHDHTRDHESLVEESPGAGKISRHLHERSGERLWGTALGNGPWAPASLPASRLLAKAG